MISVIIPVYNSERFLRETLVSLQNQTFSEFEAIIIDDGSTDDSGKIADSFVDSDNRFHVYHRDNHGVSSTRNFGFKIAKGEWVYFLDSDDIMEQNMLETMMKASSGCNDMIVSSVFFNYLDGREDIIWQDDRLLASKEDIACYLEKLEGKRKDLLLNYLWNHLFKKRIIDDNVLMFDENVSLGEDFLFICEYVKHCQSIVLLNKSLYHYYIRSIGLTSKFDFHEHNRRFIVRKTFLDLLRTFCNENVSMQVFYSYEGYYTFISLQKITLPSCRLSRHEKHLYIKEFLSTDDKKLMKYYLARHMSLKNMIWYVLISLNMSHTIVFLLDR